MKGLGVNRGRWRKSSYSGSHTNDCLESIWKEDGLILARDSSSTAEIELAIPRKTWIEFVHSVCSYKR
ncbi:DUF397 domain-containing protein [Nocardiopsis sp. LOL_012]|uniref:DUF397 domain-containing protein n=1 Tax=Nocardiopsis sp. LOL_012 TaxID=3345409 RepID=UPI003A8C376A